MPTVLRIGNFRVVIYPNDHRPAHVHIIGPEGEAVFVLDCPQGPPTLRENYGLRANDLQSIVSALIEALADLCKKWNEIHGAA